MKYEDTPRPGIEQHYHIRELIESQEKRSNDRSDHRDKEKAKQEREDLIKDAQPFTLTEFFCKKCDVDFKAQAIKEVEIDWSNSSQSVAFYKTKCFQGHWCIRFITDKLKDPFWMNSRKVAEDRGKHYRDILQPFETGYNLLYKKI